MKVTLRDAGFSNNYPNHCWEAVIIFDSPQAQPNLFEGFGLGNFGDCKDYQGSRDLSLPSGSNFTGVIAYYDGKPSFSDDKLSGCFDGVRGLEIEMTREQALSTAHQGECIDDVRELLKLPEIVAQLDKIGSADIRAALYDCGGWEDDELTDETANRERAVWMAACDIVESLNAKDV